VTVEGPIDLALHVASLLEAADVRYALGGSLAASLLAEPRTTVDIDMAAQLTMDRLGHLLDQATAEFYVPVQDAHLAVAQATSFNMVHHGSGLKVDLFVMGSGLLDTRQIERRIEFTVRALPHSRLWVTSPEDLILRKLSWFRDGGSVSDRQWRDVIGLLTAQSEYLDTADLWETADAVGLGTLLQRAMDDARL
jgi:hypothetical protein